LWSDEGLTRFNELKEEAKKDWATRKGRAFNRKVLQEDFWKNSAGRRGRKRWLEETPSSVVEIVDDLSYDSDESSSDDQGE
jgi:hypothetical protein